MGHRIRVEVNGTTHEREVEPRTLLVHFLREALGPTGANVGCETSLCGACTVLIDGRSVKSCTQLAVQADGSAITTIEGLPASAGLERGELHPLQSAFREHHGLQCGYCTPGMIMAAAGFLADDPSPSPTEIRENLKGNICRCTGYHNIIEAISSAAETMQGEGGES